MKSNRRNFLKLTTLGLGVAPIIGKILGLDNSALAAKGKSEDAKIKLQGYINTGKAPENKASKKKYDAHMKQLTSALKNGKKDVPQCANCKHYKPQKGKDGWGKCAMVGATGKEGKLVSKDGWCKVWSLNKKALS